MEQFDQEAFEEADLSVLGELDLHTFVQAREFSNILTLETDGFCSTSLNIQNLWTGLESN